MIAARSGAAGLAGLPILAIILSGTSLPSCRPRQGSPAASPATSEGRPGQPLQLFDLAERARVLTHEMHGRRDAFESYFSSDIASAGMHVIAPRHACALHFHHGSHEATAIITGGPEVSFAFAGRDGQLARRTGTLRPGMIASAPPFCGHTWVNPSATATQANLVFSSPPFDGNHFVGPGDARLHQGGEPRIFDPDVLLAALAPSRPFALETLAVLHGRLSSLLVRGETTLAAATSARLIYTARGRAMVRTDRETLVVRPQHLLLVHPGTLLRIRAEAPTAMFLLVPDGETPQPPRAATGGP